MTNNIAIKDGSGSSVTMKAKDNSAVLTPHHYIDGSKVVSASYTRPADTTAYAAGDVMSDSTSAPTVLTFSGCALNNGEGGTIESAILVDSVNQAIKGWFELWLFDTAPAAENDNAAFAPSDAETLTLLAVITFSSWYVGTVTSGAGGNAISPSGAVNEDFTCGAATTSLFGLLVSRNAYTPVSGEIFTIRLKLRQG